MAADPLGLRVLGFYASHADQWAALQSDRRRTFAIEVDGSGRVGFIEIEVLDPETRATFSVFIDTRYRGRGHGIAAIDALIAWASEHTAIEELATDTEDWNGPSIRALTRCGFTAAVDTAGRCGFRRSL